VTRGSTPTTRSFIPSSPNSSSGSGRFSNRRRRTTRSGIPAARLATWSIGAISPTATSGAWVGNLAPALLAGGAGPAVRALRAARAASTLDRAVTAGEGDAALARAHSARGYVRPLSTARKKTVAADGSPTLSGWARPRPDGFHQASPEQIRNLADQINHRLEPSTPPHKGYAGHDPGFSGKAAASHAEKQQLLTRTSDHIGVTRPMCPDCQAMFKKYVDYTGHPLYVTDPKGSHTFYPTIRPRGADAGAAALAAGSGHHHG